MKILFYGTKNYDEQFFQKLLPEYPEFLSSLLRQISVRKLRRSLPDMRVYVHLSMRTSEQA